MPKAESAFASITSGWHAQVAAMRKLGRGRTTCSKLKQALMQVTMCVLQSSMY